MKLLQKLIELFPQTASFFDRLRQRNIPVRLNPNLQDDFVLGFANEMRERVIGQDDAVQAITEIYQTMRAKMSPPDRPMASLLFLGSTGCGKTHCVEAMAETLFKNSKAIIKVNCAEFQHSHEIAKMIGAPPGYLGHRETRPIFSVDSLSKFHTEAHPFSLVLFDEIEKASHTLWNLLLGILDKAELNLGDNTMLNLSSTVVFMTSNLGGKEMSAALAGNGLGFQTCEATNVGSIASKATDKHFSPEFLNRLDKIVVFNPLSEESLLQIVDLELRAVQQRIFSCAAGPFILRTTTPAKKFLLEKGTDPKYGARPLKRTIEKMVVNPLCSMISSGQIQLQDVVTVSLNRMQNSLEFNKLAKAATA